MATKEEVEQALDELLDRLGASDEAARAIGKSLPEGRILSLHVTDLRLRYWTELAGGRAGPLQEGEVAEADIKISTGSDDLIALVEGAGSVFSAYLAGRVRIEASFSDLLKLRKLA